MSSIPALRELLERRFPGAQPLAMGGAAEPVATGIPELDAMLPCGGLPRGRLTLCRPGGGVTAVLRSACHAAVGRGERAAWIDGPGTVAGVSWRAGPTLLKPASSSAALECAEELARSGGFALVILSLSYHRRRRRRAHRSWRTSRRTSPVPAPALDAALVRLSRAAREGGAALAVLASHSPVAALRIESRLRPEDYAWRPGPFGEPVEVAAVWVRVRAATPGWQGEVRVQLPVARCPEWMEGGSGADRRGAPTGAAAAGWSGPTGAAAAGRSGPTGAAAAGRGGPTGAAAAGWSGPTGVAGRGRA